MSLAGRNDSPSINDGLVVAGHANAAKPILRLSFKGRLQLLVTLFDSGTQKSCPFNPFMHSVAVLDPTGVLVKHSTSAVDVALEHNSKVLRIDMHF